MRDEKPVSITGDVPADALNKLIEAAIIRPLIADSRLDVPLIQHGLNALLGQDACALKLSSVQYRRNQPGHLRRRSNEVRGSIAVEEEPIEPGPSVIVFANVVERPRWERKARGRKNPEA